MKEQKLVTVALDEIAFSTTNPRGKDFTSRPDWPDFLDSVKQHGVKQPPLVRPLPKDHKDAPKDAVYELVAGERRVTAARAAKLPEIRVLVETMSDGEAFIFQQIENLQREDLTPLEEAKSYDDLKNRLLKDGTCKTVDEAVATICAKVNRKRSAVYQKLTLLRLHEPVRAALVGDKISASVAGVIAKVPDKQKQEALLQQVLDGNWNDEPLSFRETEDLLEEEYAKSLKDGPFEQADAKLVPIHWRLEAGKETIVLESPNRPKVPNLSTIGVPKQHIGTMAHPGCFITDAHGYEIAGPLGKKDAKAFVEWLAKNAKVVVAVTVTRAWGGACADCPHRSGVLDPDSKSPNVCTVPDCFALKVKAHWTQKAGELQTAGQEVLTPGELKKRGPHVPGDKFEYTSNRSGSWETLMGRHKPAAVLVATKAGIKKFYPKDAALAAARKNGTKFYTHNQPQTAAEKAKEEAKEAARKATGERREQLLKALVPELVQALAKLSDTKAWELALLLEHTNGGYDGAYQKLFGKPKTPRLQFLAGRFAREYPMDYYKNWEPDCLKAWKFAGVDLAARAAAEEKKLTKALPRKGAKGAKKGRGK